MKAASVTIRSSLCPELDRWMDLTLIMDTLNINSHSFSCMISICDKQSVVVL